MKMRKSGYSGGIRKRGIDVQSSILVFLVMMGDMEKKEIYNDSSTNMRMRIDNL